MKSGKKILLFVIFISLCIFIFFALGPNGYKLEKDSVHYFPLQSTVGVRLGYPLFLATIYSVVGDFNFYNGVMVVQGIIASMCVIDFVYFLKKEFSLNSIESILMLLSSSLPFILDYPEYITTHEIWTEGITYALFYPYVKTMYLAIAHKSKKYVVYNIFIAFLLSMTRSQLLLLWISTALMISVFLLIYNKSTTSFLNKKAVKRKLAVSLIAFFIILGAGVQLTTTSDYFLRVALFETRNTDAETAENTHNEGQKTVSSLQTVSALFGRTTFAAKRDDVTIFKDPEIAEAYLEVIDDILEAGYNYQYSKKGLWQWRDIAVASDNNQRIGINALERFYTAKYGNTGETYGKILTTYNVISQELLKHNWIYYVRDTLILLPVGFVCTVFFQVESIYGICYIIAFLLYALAIGLILKNLICRSKEIQATVFMSIIIIINIIFVVVTNLIYVGIQRYLIYAFGMFYIGLYLLLRQTKMFQKMKQKIGTDTNH